MLLLILSLILVACSVIIKLLFYKRAGYRNAKRFYDSLYKLYNQRNIWELQSIKPKMFMKVSNITNILLWLGLIIGFIGYILKK